MLFLRTSRTKSTNRCLGLKCIYKCMNVVYRFGLQERSSKELKLIQCIAVLWKMWVFTIFVQSRDKTNQEIEMFDFTVFILMLISKPYPSPT